MLRETAREPSEQKGVWPEVMFGPCCGQGPTRRDSATGALDSGGPALTAGTDHGRTWLGDGPPAPGCALCSTSHAKLRG